MNGDLDESYLRVFRKSIGIKPGFIFDTRLKSDNGKIWTFYCKGFITKPRIQ